MIESSKKESLYATRDFTIEELEELLLFCDRPSIDKEVKIMFGAMAFSLKEFLLSMASRYDVSKH